mmetsp:Transcript_12598/g.24429  ORF Transcript_12598/g.24429 Transcript_12598/m.24429 type:complete len:410 (+) Transcript_12598:986-2215(+)|eukprot:CAMPEP_0171521864 /NCGR_PEP_ID=MMETSP0959-20130129/7393_1 /TAXON_ID=87120 /ORGANISM="Aurantiochytrium limacinum, Strain ATCCMYA-1381" /LENGTH=409 /DNA_ID=CAMNT_0012061861 /DNA_START=1021 /DNA_END=2250 /DNA_ORIENTATION=-
MAPTKVVVVGAGFCGSAVASSLSKQVKADEVELTLIDERECFVHKIGALRASVQEEWAKKVLVPRDNLLKHGRVITDEVKQVTEKNVVLKSGESIAFDYCVIATGASNRSPGEPSPALRTQKELTSFFVEKAEAIRKASKITIIGGGVVGVELSGEIKSQYQDKEVTIIHAGKTLISSSYPPLSKKFQESLHAQLQDLGVNVILDTQAKIDLSKLGEETMITGAQTIETSSGRRVETDLTLICAGVTPNSKALPSNWLAENKYVIVDDKLRVIGTQNQVRDGIYALGDIVALQENKMAYFGGMMADVVAKNILAQIKGGSPKSTYAVHDSSAIMLVPLGPDLGVASLPFGVFGAFFTRMLKSKTLMVENSWKSHDAIPEGEERSSFNIPTTIACLAAAGAAVAAYMYSS